MFFFRFFSICFKVAISALHQMNQILFLNERIAKNEKKSHEMNFTVLRCFLLFPIFFFYFCFALSKLRINYQLHGSLFFNKNRYFSLFFIHLCMKYEPRKIIDAKWDEWQSHITITHHALFICYSSYHTTGKWNICAESLRSKQTHQLPRNIFVAFAEELLVNKSRKKTCFSHHIVENRANSIIDATKWFFSPDFSPTCYTISFDLKQKIPIYLSGKRKKCLI